MARKRTSDVTVDSDEEENAASSPHQSKRARRGGDLDAQSIASDHASQEERSSDSDSQMEVDADEERAYEEAIRTQTQHKSQQNSTGEVAQSGIIERIDLINFMNHADHTQMLGPQVNFIVGQNGTGKSAILAALVVGLGGNATASERGRSLSQLIRKGTDRAEIRIRIKNKGADAYKRDIFGDAIVVERILSMKSGSSIKLRSASGQIISTKRAELIAMLDHLSIQIDNPITVLMQENAKAFLANSTAQDKYQFFLRGTMLKQLAEEYERIHMTIRAIHHDLVKSQSGLKNLSKTAQESKERYDRLRKIDGIDEKLEALRGEILWGYVAATEKHLDEAAFEVEECLARIAEVEQNITTAEQQREEVDEQIQQVEVQKNEHENRDDGNSDRLKELKALIDGQSREIKAKKQQQREINSELGDKRKEKKDVEKRIKDEQKKLERFNSDSRAQKAARVEQLQREHEQLSEQLAAHRQVDIDATTAIDARREEYGALRDDIEHAKVHVERTQANLREAQSARGNSWAAYGQQMGLLLAEIEKATWKSKPYGPIGRHVKCKDQKWSRTLESFFGEQLNSFLVENDADWSKLVSLLQKLKMHGISVWKQRVVNNFNFQHGMPDASLTTVLSQLTIDNPKVQQALIDHNKIESSILVEENADAVALMRTAPRNVSAAYTLHAFRMEFLRGGSSMIAMQEYRGPPRLGKDMTQYIGGCRQAHSQAESELRDHLARKADLDRHMSDVQRQKQDAERKAKQTTRQLAEKTSDISRLSLDLQDDEPGAIAALEEERQNYEESIGLLTGQFAAIQEQIQAETAALKPWQAEKEAIDRVLDEYRQEGQIFESKLDELSTARSKIEVHKTHWTKRLKVEQEKKTGKEAAARDWALRLAEKEQQAKEIAAERPESLRTAKQAETEYEALKKVKQDHARAEGGRSPEQIRRDFVDSAEAYKQAKQAYEAHSIFQQALSCAHKERTERWSRFLRSASVQTRLLFGQNLGYRGYSGSMRLDHNKRTLDLQVQTDATMEGKLAQKEAKSLSGGEKSYSTVALLLAIWERVASPFRCLDEFDVFMDATNRRIAIKLIVDAALSANGRQHILLSPNSIQQNFTSRAGIAIWKMNDNVRGQTTLPYGTGGQD